MTVAPNGPLARARAGWGDDMPDWVMALARACERSTQTKVAQALDRSPAVISNVLARTYAASMDRIEERVRGVYLNGKVICPEKGDLPLQECQDWREKAKRFQMGNPQRTLMFGVCRKCPRYLKEQDA
jgi:hypothetical protein